MMQNGASATGAQAKQYVQALLNHGVSTCSPEYTLASFANTTYSVKSAVVFPPMVGT